MVDATMLTLEKVLDLRSKAHSLHTSNLANSNVPEFKARKIDFEARMKVALDSMDGDNNPLLQREGVTAQRVDAVEADVYQDPLAKPSGDGNTVNVDKEQAEIAKNMIGYQGAIQLLNKKLALQKYVLTEGAR